MSAPIFPTLSDGMDSSKYSEELEDNTISEQMEGGYTVTRARTTRRARKTFNVGYTHITDGDKALLEVFWDVTSGGARIFLWTNSADSVEYQVRFKGKLKFSYEGRLGYRRWDCEMSLEQA